MDMALKSKWWYQEKTSRKKKKKVQCRNMENTEKNRKENFLMLTTVQRVKMQGKYRPTRRGGYCRV